MFCGIGRNKSDEHCKKPPKIFKYPSTSPITVKEKADKKSSRASISPITVPRSKSDKIFDEAVKKFNPVILKIPLQYKDEGGANASNFDKNSFLFHFSFTFHKASAISFLLNLDNALPSIPSFTFSSKLNLFMIKNKFFLVSFLKSKFVLYIIYIIYNIFLCK